MQNQKIISNGRTNGVTWSLLELLITAKNNSQALMLPIIKVLLQKANNLKKIFRTDGRTNGVTWSLLELLIAAKKKLLFK